MCTWCLRKINFRCAAALLQGSTRCVVLHSSDIVKRSSLSYHTESRNCTAPRDDASFLRNGLALFLQHFLGWPGQIKITCIATRLPFTVKEMHSTLRLHFEVWNGWNLTAPRRRLSKQNTDPWNVKVQSSKTSTAKTKKEQCLQMLFSLFPCLPVSFFFLHSDEFNWPSGDTNHP